MVRAAALHLSPLYDPPLESSHSNPLIFLFSRLCCRASPLPALHLPLESSDGSPFSLQLRSGASAGDWPGSSARS